MCQKWWKQENFQIRTEERNHSELLGGAARVQSVEEKGSLRCVYFEETGEERIDQLKWVESQGLDRKEKCNTEGPRASWRWIPLASGCFGHGLILRGIRTANASKKHPFPLGWKCKGFAHRLGAMVWSHLGEHMTSWVSSFLLQPPAQGNSSSSKMIRRSFYLTCFPDSPLRP